MVRSAASGLAFALRKRVPAGLCFGYGTIDGEDIRRALLDLGRALG